MDKLTGMTVFVRVAKAGSFAAGGKGTGHLQGDGDQAHYAA